MDPKHAFRLVRQASGFTDTHHIDGDALARHPQTMMTLCRGLAGLFQAEGVDVVVAPPGTAAAILCYGTAQRLCEITGRDVRSVCAEERTDSFRHPDTIGVLSSGPIKRAFTKSGEFVIWASGKELIRKKRVLVIDFATGTPAVKTMDLVRKFDGMVVGLGILGMHQGLNPEEMGGPPKIESVLEPGIGVGRDFADIQT